MKPYVTMILAFAATVVGATPFMQKFAHTAEASTAENQCTVEKAAETERKNPNRVLFISCGGFL
jgi:hypothetical protein